MIATALVSTVRNSPLEEALPVADVVVVADQDGGRHRARHNRVFDQTQARLVRQAVTFAGVHFPVRQDTVMKNASAGVLTWIACQLRFNTRTVDK